MWEIWTVDVWRGFWNNQNTAESSKIGLQSLMRFWILSHWKFRARFTITWCRSTCTEIYFRKLICYCNQGVRVLLLVVMNSNALGAYSIVLKAAKHSSFQLHCCYTYNQKFLLGFHLIQCIIVNLHGQLIFYVSPKARKSAKEHNTSDCRHLVLHLIFCR